MISVFLFRFILASCPLVGDKSPHDITLVSANDELVDLFIKKKINYKDITKNLLKIINLKKFKRLKLKMPKNVNQIYKLNHYVRLKTRLLSIK